VVSSKLPTADVTFLIQHGAFSLSSIVGPVTIIDLLDAGVVHSSSSITLAVLVLSVVDVSGDLIVHATLFSFTIILPTTLIDRAVEINNLSETFLYKGTVLAVVKVTTSVHQFTGACTTSLLKHAFKDNSRGLEHTSKPIHLIVDEGTSIDATIWETHLSLETHIVLPNANEATLISPRDGALTFPLTGFPHTFIGCFFEL
jgi:hypothetical protein